MEGSDETAVIQGFDSSIGDNSSSKMLNQAINQAQLGINGENQSNYGKRSVLGMPPSHPLSQIRVSNATSFDRLSLPPLRGHRRCNSDAQLRISPPSSSAAAENPAKLIMKREGEIDDKDGLISAYMMNYGGNDEGSVEEKDSKSSENDGDSSGISSNSIEKVGGGGGGDGRHGRSLSIDSFMENFRGLNGEMSSMVAPPPPPPPQLSMSTSSGARSAQHSPSSSMDGSTGLFSLEFGNVQFSSEELKKIMANEKLVEFAKADPKRVKRILANRVSAARSKERKTRYIAELEYKVQTLQTEATSLSTQLTYLQRDSADLVNQNNELRFRLQALDQQAQLRDALNEALRDDIQRLRIAAGMRDICLPQQVVHNNHAFQTQMSSHNMHQSQQSQENAGCSHNQPVQSVKEEGS